MKRKLRFAGPVAAVIAVALAATGCGSGSDQTELSLTLKGSEDQMVDNPPHGLSGGDMFVGADTAFDRAGKRIGTGLGVCVLTVTKPLSGQCNDTLTLPDGQLTIQGGGPFKERSSSRAIIGGTGAYAGARGTVEVTETGAYSQDATFHYSLP
jgi:hypothetical protein